MDIKKRIPAAFHSFLVIGSLLIMLVSGAFYSQAETFQNNISPNNTYEYYWLGEEAAIENTHTAGSFFIGIPFGLTLPFATGGAAALAYQSTGKLGDIFGPVSGIGSAVIWLKSGSRLTRIDRISVPEHYTVGMSPDNRQAFEKGYTETVQEKRNAAYNLGVITGLLIPIAFVCYIISQFEGPIGGV